jgi:hypothetical protein
METAEDIVSCVEHSLLSNPNNNDLAKRLPGIKVSLKYYQQIMAIASGYGKWANVEESLGVRRFSIEFNSLSEAQVIRSTLKKAQRHLKAILRNIKQETTLYSSPDYLMSLINPKFAPKGSLSKSLERKLDGFFSYSGLAYSIKDGLEQIDRLLVEIEIFIETHTDTDHTETKETKREAISAEDKRFVWKRDDGRCVKCGSQNRLEFDHIIPVSKGGSNTARNLQLLCESCNRRKYVSLD